MALRIVCPAVKEFGGFICRRVLFLLEGPGDPEMKVQIRCPKCGSDAEVNGAGNIRVVAPGKGMLAAQSVAITRGPIESPGFAMAKGG